jgi:hypothetical protein
VCLVVTESGRSLIGEAGFIASLNLTMLYSDGCSASLRLFNFRFMLDISESGLT